MLKKQSLSVFGTWKDGARLIQKEYEAKAAE